MHTASAPPPFPPEGHAHTTPPSTHAHLRLQSGSHTDPYDTYTCAAATAGQSRTATCKTSCSPPRTRNPPLWQKCHGRCAQPWHVLVEPPWLFLHVPCAQTPFGTLAIHPNQPPCLTQHALPPWPLPPHAATALPCAMCCTAQHSTAWPDDVMSRPASTLCNPTPTTAVPTPHRACTLLIPNACLCPLPLRRPNTAAAAAGGIGAPRPRPRQHLPSVQAQRPAELVDGLRYSGRAEQYGVSWNGYTGSAHHSTW